MKAQPVYTVSKRNHILLNICSSIISQQLSTRVAEVIFNRFLQLFKTKTPSALEILNINHHQLRSIGLSNAKAVYVKNVCSFFMEHKITDARLHKMQTEEFIAFITQIKGIGRWSAEMILMSTLGREDIFSAGDLGIQQAMTKLYGLDSTNKKQLQAQMEAIAANWSPYRTYACRYLWGWKDSATAEKSAKKTVSKKTSDPVAKKSKLK